MSDYVKERGYKYSLDIMLSDLSIACGCNIVHDEINVTFTGVHYGAQYRECIPLILPIRGLFGCDERYKHSNMFYMIVDVGRMKIPLWFRKKYKDESDPSNPGWDSYITNTISDIYDPFEQGM